MFCTKCGTRLDDDAAFCASCGAPVQDAFAPDEPAQQVAGASVPAGQTAPFASPAPQQAPAYQQPYQQPPTKKSHTGIIIVLVIAIAAAVAAALYFAGVFVHDKNASTTTSTAQVAGNAQQSPDESGQAASSSTQGQPQASEPAQSQTVTSTPTSQSSSSGPSSDGAVTEGDRFFDDTVYTNSRYGYSILIPAGFECVSLSENGDGGLFSNDYGVDISTYGYNNSGGQYGLEDRYDEMVAEYDPEYSTILEDKSAFVVSWVDGNKEYYHMEYVGSGSIQAFEISYAAGDARGDAIVEEVQPTFTSGNISVGH